MKTYTFDNKVFTTKETLVLYFPEFGKYNPLSDTILESLGVTIGDDGLPTPEQRLLSELLEVVQNLKQKYPDVSVDEFVAVCKQGFSAEIISWAKDAGISNEDISSTRLLILGFIADASRLGITFDRLITMVEEAVKNMQENDND